MTTSNPVNTTVSLETTNLPLSALGLFRKYFGEYCILIINLVGLIGNLLTVYVFVRHRKRTGPVAIYFVCLALSDSGNLVMGLQTWFHNGLYYITDGAVDLPSAVSDTACKIRVFIWNVFVAMSGYIIVAFSLERVIAIWAPLKAATIITNFRRNVVLTILLAYASLSSSLFFFTKKLGQIKYRNRIVTACYNVPGTEVVHLYSRVIQLFNLIVPCILIFLFNVLIIVGIRHAQDMAKSTKAKLKDKTTDSKIVLNLLVISLVYVITIGLYTIFTLIRIAIQNGLLHISAANRDIFRDWENITTNVIVFNYSGNFIMYALSLDFYRQTIKELTCFFCYNRKKKSCSSNVVTI